MTSKQFLSFCGAGFVIVAAVIIPLNVYADIYGLFSPVRGRGLAIYGEERIAKYLHSFRYIPENFDGLLLGSSVSLVMDTRALSGYHIYNASINGGNVEDLKPIAENVFRKGKLKLTVICMHRYLTNDHVEKTDLITPQQYWAALGSPQLLTAYISRLATLLGIVPSRYDEYGTLHSSADVDSNSVRRNIDKAVIGIQRGTVSIGNYYIDPVALRELEGIMVDARQQGQTLVIFYPPIPQPVLAVRSIEFAHYRATINALLSADDIVLDFNSARYESLRTDPHNFVDAVHLSKTGANFVVSELSKLLEQTDVERNTALH